jgi:rubrerythrin
MGIRFNADEIFSMAERIEINGAIFYRNVAEKTIDETARNVLLKLAEEEDKHEKVFTSMRAELTQGERQLVQFDPNNQGILYLNAMADSNVFDYNARPSSMLSGSEDAADILRTAIHLEKESIVFYTGIRDMVPENMGREKIDEIIREEMRHITLLSQDLVKLK